LSVGEAEKIEYDASGPTVFNGHGLLFLNWSSALEID